MKIFQYLFSSPGKVLPEDRSLQTCSFCHGRTRCLWTLHLCRVLLTNDTSSPPKVWATSWSCISVWGGVETAPEHPPPAVVSSRLQTDIFLNGFLTAMSEKVSERCPAPYICVCVCIYIPTHRNQDRHLVHTCVCIYIYIYTNINQKSS